MKNNPVKILLLYVFVFSSILICKTESEWEFIKGSETPDRSMLEVRQTPLYPIYPTDFKNYSETTNPGCRSEFSYCQMDESRFFIFGGNYIYDNVYLKADLWEYNLDEDKWSWHYGDGCDDKNNECVNAFSTYYSGSYNPPYKVNEIAGSSMVCIPEENSLYIMFGRSSFVAHSYFDDMLNQNNLTYNQIFLYDIDNRNFSLLLGNTSEKMDEGFYPSPLSGLAGRPASRSGAAVSRFGDEIAIFGGAHGNGKKFLNDLWVFKMETNELIFVKEYDTRYDSMGYYSNPKYNWPRSRSEPAVWTIGNFMYMFGGMAKIQTSSSAVDIMYFLSDMWKYNHSCTQENGNMFSWRGRRDQYDLNVAPNLGVKKVFSFEVNPQGSNMYYTWTVPGDTNSLYMFGGNRAVFDKYDYLWEYSIKKDNFRLIYGEGYDALTDLDNNIVGSRSGGGVFVDKDGYPYFFGGHFENGKQYSVTDSFWRFNNLSTCFNVYKYDYENVCLGRGTCEDYDVCNCNGGFFGLICDDWNCFSYHRNNTNVCSGSGTCIAPNNCTCNEGYYAENCDEWYCFGIPRSNTSDVCNSGNGTCVKYNECECLDGIYGTFCDIFTCNGVIGNDTANVCSGYGDCIFSDTCVCKEGYSGEWCEIWSCYGIENTNQSYVCNGNGVCEDFDVCTCTNDYWGEKCENFSCYGVNEQSEETCSSHGDCVLPDVCSCWNEDVFFGDNCEFFYCFGVSSELEDLVCNRNGECTTTDTCKCNNNFFGENCLEEIRSATLSDDCTFINVIYKVPEDTLSEKGMLESFDCSNIKNAEDLFGVDSSCEFSVMGGYSSHLYIELSPTATIVPGDNFTFNALSEENAQHQLQLKGPNIEDVPTPIVILKRTTDCQNGTLLVQSASYDQRGLSCQWSLYDSENPTIPICYTTDEDFSLPSSCPDSESLVPFHKYRVSLSCKNFIGAVGEDEIECQGKPLLSTEEITVLSSVLGGLGLGFFVCIMLIIIVVFIVLLIVFKNKRKEDSEIFELEETEKETKKEEESEGEEDEDDDDKKRKRKSKQRKGGKKKKRGRSKKGKKGKRKRKDGKKKKTTKKTPKGVKKIKKRAQRTESFMEREKTRKELQLSSDEESEDDGATPNDISLNVEDSDQSDNSIENDSEEEEENDSEEEEENESEQEENDEKEENENETESEEEKESEDERKKELNLSEDEEESESDESV